FIVLKFSQQPFAFFSVIGSYTNAIKRVFALGILIYQISYQCCVSLIGTKNYCLFVLVGFFQKDIYSLGFSFYNFNCAVKVLFFVEFTFFYFAFHNGIV